MKLALRGTFAAMAVGGLLLIGSVAPTFAAQPASPLAPEVTSAGGAQPCSAQRTAAKDNSVAKLRALGDCEINRRLVTITVLQNHVANPNGLTHGDLTALQTLLTADTSGLTALKVTIDAETDVTALHTDIGTIVTGYRIYLLMVPLTAEVISADNEATAVSRLQAMATKLQARITAAGTAGKDVTQAQDDLNSMTTALGQVNTTTLAGIPAALLVLTPAEYNGVTTGPTTKALLKTDHTTLQGFRASLNAARADALACRAALRAL